MMYSSIDIFQKQIVPQSQDLNLLLPLTYTIYIVRMKKVIMKYCMSFISQVKPGSQAGCFVVVPGVYRLYLEVC